MSTTDSRSEPRAAHDYASLDPAEVEAVRREHLRREASIHALALLHHLLGIGVVLGTLYSLATGSNGGLEIRPGVWGAIDLSVYGVGAVAMFLIGTSLRKLRRWARIAAIVVCSIMLLRFPVGTLICPYLLYLLLTAKGKRVFAPDYATIVEATPHLTPPRSVVVGTVLTALAVVAALYALRFAIRG